MANIDLVGFVHEIKNNKKVTVVETHRKKGEDGNYYTASRTYRTIKPGYDFKQDLGHLNKGDRVEIKGRELTEEWEYEGKKYKDLVVLVDTLTIQAKSEDSQVTRVQRTTDLAIDLEAPF